VYLLSLRGSPRQRGAAAIQLDRHGPLCGPRDGIIRARIISKGRPFHLRVGGAVHTADAFPMMNILLLPFAQAPVVDTWHATSLGQALLYTAIFSLAGTLLAIVGYKLFDLCTPGDLHEEIVKNRNLAAAIIGAAIILGVSIVVAAAIMG
jgi:putative membrane protein